MPTTESEKGKERAYLLWVDITINKDYLTTEFTILDIKFVYAFHCEIKIWDTKRLQNFSKADFDQIRNELMFKKMLFKLKQDTKVIAWRKILKTNVSKNLNFFKEINEQTITFSDKKIKFVLASKSLPW